MRSSSKLSVVHGSPVSSGALTAYIALAILCILLLSIYSAYLVLMIAFGVLPGMVAVLIDQERQKYISKIVMMFNIVGITPYIFKIVHNNDPDFIAVDLMAEPITWMVIFGSAAIGWLIYWFFPEAALVFFDAKIENRISKLQKELDELCKEWGDDIRSSIRNSR